MMLPPNLHFESFKSSFFSVAMSTRSMHVGFVRDEALWRKGVLDYFCFSSDTREEYKWILLPKNASKTSLNAVAGTTNTLKNGRELFSFITRSSTYLCRY